MKRKISLILLLAALISMLLTGCFPIDEGGDGPKAPSVSLDSIPEFDGSTPFVYINGNKPFFEDERCDSSYESFSELDSLGRCGTAIACIGIDIMPTEDRGEIGHVRPSGWHSAEYDVVPGKNLYHRCHLIGFQLTGENDNERNLITGTRNMNNEGMLPFENMIADYVKDTENHVLYRVTPIFEGNELVARGVLMEAKSIEDDEISFCIYVYNAQPGVEINYKTGESRLADHPHSSVINQNHDNLEIIPDAADDTVTHMYAEYDGDEFLGAVIITSVKVGKSTVTVAADIDENGNIDYIKILSGVSGNSLDGFLADFVDETLATAESVELVSGLETLSAAVRGVVIDSLEAFDAYVDATENGEEFVINISSGKFHEATCSGAISMSEKNKLVYVGYYADLISAGYSPCGTCRPGE